MALTNAERQARHRELIKQRLAMADNRPASGASAGYRARIKELEAQLEEARLRIEGQEGVIAAYKQAAHKPPKGKDAVKSFEALMGQIAQQGAREKRLREASSGSSEAISIRMTNGTVT